MTETAILLQADWPTCSKTTGAIGLNRSTGNTEGAVFRAINKAGRIAPHGFSPKVIWVLSNKLLGVADLRTLRHTSSPNVRALVSRSGGELE